MVIEFTIVINIQLWVRLRYGSPRAPRRHLSSSSVEPNEPAAQPQSPHSTHIFTAKSKIYLGYLCHSISNIGCNLSKQLAINMFENIIFCFIPIQPQPSHWELGSCSILLAQSLLESEASLSCPSVPIKLWTRGGWGIFHNPPTAAIAGRTHLSPHGWEEKPISSSGGSSSNNQNPMMEGGGGTRQAGYSISTWVGVWLNDGTRVALLDGM